jgi:hypothetical protein
MPGRPAVTRLEDLPSQSRARSRRSRPLAWPTIGFKLLYGLAIIHLAQRRLVWANATTNPTAEWIAQQLTEAIARRTSGMHFAHSFCLAQRMPERSCRERSAGRTVDVGNDTPVLARRRRWFFGRGLYAQSSRALLLDRDQGC